MGLLSKYLLYFIFGIILLFPMTAQAGTLRVEKFASPIKLANKISQPVNLSFVSEGNWKLFVEALDSRIMNLDNPNYSIPITRLELAELGGNPISSFGMGKILEIRNGANCGLNSMNLALNAIMNDCDRPGNYIADVRFTLVNQNSVVSEDIYSFRFRQDEISKIDFTNKVVNLSLDRDKILRKSSSQNLSTPLGLYISSNKNWKLYIRKVSNSKDTTLSYFVKVLGGDQSVNCNISSAYIPLNENKILLASGKLTINETMNCLDKKIINIDYMVKGPDDQFIPAGSRSEEFEYRLETED